MNSPPMVQPSSPVCPGAPELDGVARRARRGDAAAVADDGPTPRCLFPPLLPDCVYECTPSRGVQNLRAALGMSTEHVERMQRAKKAIENA